MGRKISLVGWAHVVAVCLALTVVAFSARRRHASSVQSFNTPSTPLPSAPGVPQDRASFRVVSRPLYPYSVIPGGVASMQELAYDVAHDAVVAQHYSDFDVAKASVVRLDQDKLVYVSYRMGDRIFWTNKKLRIPKGETVITDGAHLARSRCGNRLSDFMTQPQAPIPPPLEALETPAAPEIASEIAPPLFPAVPPVFPPPAGVTPPTSPPVGIVIPPPYYPPIGGGGSPPPIKVPEPGVPELVMLGVSAVFGVRWLRLVRAHRNKDNSSR